MTNSRHSSTTYNSMSLSVNQEWWVRVKPKYYDFICTKTPSELWSHPQGRMMLYWHWASITFPFLLPLTCYFFYLILPHSWPYFHPVVGRAIIIFKTYYFLSLRLRQWEGGLPPRHFCLEENIPHWTHSHIITIQQNSAAKRETFRLFSTAWAWERLRGEKQYTHQRQCEPEMG
jgi:hypothetical protein